MGNERNIIIGLVGQPASGKDTVADCLVLSGFSKIGLGDILREEMQKQNILTNRSNMQKFVSEMRKKYGNGYLAEKTIERIRGNAVISGIRNTEEVKVYKEKLGNRFKLIAVDSPIDIRYQRARERGRVGDDISFEQFKAEEEKEMAAQSGSFEVDLVISLADYIIENKGTREELCLKVDDLLRALMKAD